MRLNGRPDGIVGLELYESVALLRSLAVSRVSRSRAAAQRLWHKRTIRAVARGSGRIYLL